MTAQTRRAALGALATLPSLALPAVAGAAGPDHPDADIFALIGRCREVDKFWSADSAAREKVLWAHVGAAHPPKWTDADASVWPIVTPGEQLHTSELDSLRACFAVPALWGTLNFPPQAFAERAREILAALDDWLNVLKAAREHPDVVAAQAEADAHGVEWRDLAERLARTPAKTVDGIIAKLAMVATDMAYGEEDLDGADYDGIAMSAALDAMRLQKAGA